MILLDVEPPALREALRNSRHALRNSTNGSLNPGVSAGMLGERSGRVRALSLPKGLDKSSRPGDV